MWSASIRVVDDDGEPLSGRKVHISFSFWDGYDTVYTDDDGWAEFEYESIDADKQMYVDDIYIDDVHVGEDFYLSNGDTKSYTKP